MSLLDKKLFFIVFILLISFNYVSYSQSVDDLQKQIEDRNKQIENLQKEIDSYNSKISSSQSEAKTLKSTIANLELQKNSLKNQIAITNIQIENTKNIITNTVDKINQNQSEINKQKIALAKSLVNIKIGEDSNSLVLDVLSQRDQTLSDTLDQYFKLNSFNQSVNEKVDNIKEKVDELNKNKTDYEKQKSNLSNLSQNLSGQKKLVEQNTQEKSTLLSITKNNEKAYQKIVSDRKKKVQDLQDEINSFESQIKYVLDKSKLPSIGSGVFSWPLSKITITQYFGDTSFSKTGAYNGHGHNGVDFGTPIGTPLYSIGDGVVLGTGNTDASCPKASYGKWVLIKHPNGIASLYGHLSTIMVSAGDKIDRGEQIGLSGTTGYSTGPHLHLTLIVADAVKIFGPTEYKSKVCGTYMVMPYAPINSYLNPMDYLPKR